MHRLNCRLLLLSLLLPLLATFQDVLLWKLTEAWWSHFLWRIIMFCILYSSFVCHYPYFYSVQRLQDILDCIFYTIYTADLWYIRQLLWAYRLIWIQLCFIVILFHFLIHSYFHYIWVFCPICKVAVSLFACFAIINSFNIT